MILLNSLTFDSLTIMYFNIKLTIILLGKDMTTASEPSITTVPSTVPQSRQDNASVNEDDKLGKLSSKRDASWPSVLFYIHLNILGLYGIMVLFTNAYLTTVIFTTILSFIGIIGVTCGAHRLFAHQTYEANTVLKLFLMLCQTMAGQVNNGEMKNLYTHL